jgi:ABC-2 type transport system permease protein
VSQPGSIGWFVRHEARLAWRDWLSLMTAGRRRRGRTVALGFIAFAVIVHGIAWLMLSSAGDLTGAADSRIMVAITGTLVMAWSLMLSQAMESATRSFYARGDLELILTSPATASRLFAVRIVAMTATILALALVLGAPFINVLAWKGGARYWPGKVVRAGSAATWSRWRWRWTRWRSRSCSQSRCSARSARDAPEASRRPPRR